MQRHMPYDRQLPTYPKARKEYEPISEERPLSNTGGSTAERENSESLPIVRILWGLIILPLLSAVSVTLRLYSFHLREVLIASINDGFSLCSTELCREEKESSGHVSESENISSPLHLVHMRGFPTQATAQDIITVSNNKTLSLLMQTFDCYRWSDFKFLICLWVLRWNAFGNMNLLRVPGSPG